MNVITRNQIVGDPDFYPRVGYANLFRDGTVTVSGETASGPKENAYDGFTYDFWTTPAAGENWIAVQGVQSGTLQAGWNDRVRLAANASSVRNAYKGMKIRLTSGPGSAQERTIIAYDGVSKIAIVDSDWSAFDVQPSFMANFADLGDGEVDLTLLLGTGSSTFTRAGDTATTIDSNGDIVPVLANVPRSYYDPTTLQYMGYLAEGARTNLLLRSEEFDNASWTKFASSVVANSVASPDGGTTADTFAADGTSALHRVQQAFTVGTARVFSVFIKANAASFIQILFDSDVAPWANFDLSSGAVGSQGSNQTAEIKAYPNGWYRCSVYSSSTTTTGVNIAIVSSSTATRGESNSLSTSVFVWGAQLEAGAFASSYIPTAGTSVTRNADALTYPFAGNADAAVGTAYAELSTEWATSDGLSVATSFSGVTAGITSANNGVSTTLVMRDGTNTAVKTGIAAMNTGVRKAAASWGAAGLAMTADGLVPATSPFDGDLGSTAIGIGNTAGGTNQWFGTIGHVRIWQTQFTAAQLQAITGSSEYFPIPDDTTEYEIIGYADYFAIAAHTLAGSTIKPQYSDDGATWTDLAASFVVEDNGPLAFEFDGLWAEYFRLLIEDSTDPISIGAIHVGQMLTMERGLPVGWQPPSLNEDIRFTNTISEGGQTLGRNIISRGASVQLDISPVTWGFSRDEWISFIEVANIYACFFWWAYEDFGEVLYGGMTENSGQFSEVNFMNVSAKFQGIIR